MSKCNLLKIRCFRTMCTYIVFLPIAKVWTNKGTGVDARARAEARPLALAPGHRGPLHHVANLVSHSAYIPNVPFSDQAGSRAKINGLTFEQKRLIFLSTGQQHNLQGAGLLVKGLHVHTNLLQLPQLSC